jgi:curved DNA-binding protein CbpA
LRKAKRDEKQQQTFKKVAQMKTIDALNILGLSGNVSQEDIKTAWRLSALKYHPDKNAAGLEMMKIVNEAYETLKSYSNNIVFDDSEIDLDYGEKINEALNNVYNLNITIEVCGAWVWLSGNTFTVKDKIKDAGFKFARKKKAWFFRPEQYKSRNRKPWDLEQIRTTHGSKVIKQEKTSAKLTRGN